MWHLKNIPKLAHFYWGGGKLIYMRFLTIKTFMKLNPDWEVVVWYPKEPFKGKSWGIEPGYEAFNENFCKDYWPALLKLPINKMEIDFTSLNFHRNTAEVHKADFVRINTMFQYGGLWSDLDIIYFKPVSELKVNIPENKDKEVFVCISPEYGHSTGFNLATKESEFFGRLMERMPREYSSRNYQCWGPDIFNKYFKTIGDIPKGVNLDMDVVYAHNCYVVKELLNGAKPKFTDGSIGCHWYGGNSMWGRFLNQTKGGEVNLPDNIIGKLIKNG